jgi:Asp-tRNA(Asn)/Glu-tRNA(Gln) amidotransferase A subunit family amidase
LGPLHGVPVGIKDILETADMPTEYGSAIHRGNRPGADCAHVAALRAAGAVILGKTVTTELACPYPAHTLNPHDPERTPGVSSSGSAAAVADFMVPLANGTQTGGSVIRPAALCGIYGYKASLTELDPSGILHLKPFIDTLGLFARSLADIALMRAALTGKPSAEPGIEAGQPPRVGVCRTEQWPAAEPEMVAMIECVARLLAEAGAGAVDVDMPAEVGEAMSTFQIITGWEGAKANAMEIEGHLDELNPWARAGAIAAKDYTEAQYEDAKAAARRGQAALGALFDDFDVLITPSAAGESPKDLTGIETRSFNSSWNLMHVPCINLPAFSGPNSIPVGLQLIGPQNQDGRLIALAGWIERRIAETMGDLPTTIP